MAISGALGLALFVSSFLDAKLPSVQNAVNSVNHYECSYLENNFDPGEYFENGKIVKKEKTNDLKQVFIIQLL